MRQACALLAWVLVIGGRVGGAPIPADEAKRLTLLAACNIICTPAEQDFDDVARLAADLGATELAFITLVDSDCSCRSGSPSPGHTPLEIFAAVMTRPPIPIASRFEGEVPEPVDAIATRCLRKLS